MTRPTTLLALAIAALSVGCGPIGMLPGGRIRGAPAEAPSDWAALDHCELIRVETGGADPYSVNVWAAGFGERLYLAAGGGDSSRWVRNLQADPSVRVGACDRVYEMSAVHTQRADDLEAFLAAVDRKYAWEREEALEYREWVFRLEPR